MYLKKLEIFGFKSFAHKLSLEFGAGITGVVGPNGCGKTNIADAIRWVLGEQSPSEIRGSSMADVIFNGTKARRRLGMAEVSLNIDNSSGILPTDYGEVLIGRRVFRSGESEYLINKTPCRLRDIRDLFLDTGVGSRTYSLIERKMVDSVLSDSTGHRRFLFEEASGIMKYKVRKRSALLKLEATDQDMQRVADIIAEVEKQVRSLKRQLSQANRHRSYTDQLRELEIALGRHDHAESTRQRDSVGADIAKLKSELTELSGTLDAAERRRSRIRREQQDKEEALASLESEVAELESRARALADGLLVSRERRTASERRAAELEAELADLSGGLEQSEVRAAKLTEECGRASELVGERETALQLKADQVAEVQGEHRRLKELLDGQRQSRIQGLESEAELKAELETYRARLDDLMKEHVDIEGSVSKLRQTLADKEVSILEALEVERRVMEALSSDRTAVKSALAGLEEAREAALQAREAKTRLEGELASARHKLALLSEIKEAYGGFHEGVRSLLTDKSHELSGLVGTVAEVIEVDREMATAVETALGGAAQYVVTSDVGSARAAMHHLVKRSLGRASFVPLSRLGAVALREIPASVLGEEGVLGPAIQFVRCDSRVARLAEFLLEGLVVVNDIDRAVQLAGREDTDGLAFVTRDGNMVTAAGILTGGCSGNEEAAFLRRAERVEAARREIDGLLSKVAEAEKEESRLSSDLEAVARSAREMEARAENTDKDLWDAKRSVTELELAKTNLAENVSGLESRREVLAARMDDTKRGISVLADRIASLSKGKDEIGEKVEELEREFSRVDRTLANAMEEEKTAEIEAAAVRSTLAQLRSELAQLEETRTATRLSIEKKTAERREHLTAVNALGSQISTEAKTHQEIEDEKGALTLNRDSMREAARALRNETEEVDQAAKSRRDERDDVRGRLHDLELRDVELKGQADALWSRLKEEYSVDVADLGDYVPGEGEPPFDPLGTRNEVERLKARLRSMGPVNLLALEEYDEESKRLEFLKEQFSDLEKSKDSLMEAIERINTTATHKFLETFEHVRTNFVETFQRLFNGGEADLTLLDAEDPLESAIEIVASPRGKKLGRLSLLSGGERALTAIALLFGLHLVKPSPFTILDEVDAPLDDANVDRFIQLLKEFSKRTQFVIITHNKRTMQACNRLYGITMEESGVSKVVSVEFSSLGEVVEREEAVHEAV